jgi:hypothetical protein
MGMVGVTIPKRDGDETENEAEAIADGVSGGREQADRVRCNGRHDQGDDHRGVQREHHRQAAALAPSR